MDFSWFSWGVVWKGVLGITVLWIFYDSVAIVRPITRGLIERFGKYHRFAQPGFHLVIPWVERLVPVNITEQMVGHKLGEFSYTRKFKAHGGKMAAAQAAGAAAAGAPSAASAPAAATPAKPAS